MKIEITKEQIDHWHKLFEELSQSTNTPLAGLIVEIDDKQVQPNNWDKWVKVFSCIRGMQSLPSETAEIVAILDNAGYDADKLYQEVKEKGLIR